MKNNHVTRAIFTFVLLALSNQVFAQFAKIIDRDGYANLRSGASIHSKIVGKIKSGEIVYIFNKGNDNVNWVVVEYQENDRSVLSGYIHSSRLKTIDSYEMVPSLNADNSGTDFNLRNIEVNIRTELFGYEANRKYLTGRGINQKYKGQEIWGLTDGNIPKTHYKSIKATIGNKVVAIPRMEFENLFDVDNENTYCSYNNETETLYITSMNSDGSSSYEVLFIIEKGKYKGRRVYAAD